MTARVARGGAAPRRPSGSSSSSGGGSYKRRKTAPPPSVFDNLPVTPETARRIARWATLAFVLVFVIAFAFALRLPQKAGEVIGQGIGKAGFAVSRVEVRGLARMNRSRVYEIVLGQGSLAMPLVDLDAIRAQLMAEHWIREARVSRRLPDTLVVEIEERVPAAVWQQNGQLALIDDTGFPIARVGPDATANLPLVIGPGAGRQLASLNALLAAAPRLRPLLAGATWVGDRRWDLSFQTGETVSLPEGDQPAQIALRHFAQADEENRYLGGNFVRFDMRIEGQMIVRLRGAPDGEAPAAATPPAAAAPDPASQPAAARTAPPPAEPAPRRAAPETRRRAEPQDLSRTI